MGTISEVQNLAIELMRAEYTIVTNKGTHTISPFKIGYCFGFNTRKRAFGLCRYNIKKIELSLPLCTENLDKIHTQIKDTILHEIAHALSVHVHGIREGRGHGPKWKSIAKQIGCDGKRCYDGDSVNKVKGKYSLVCDHCGYETPKHRKVSRLYACAKCCNAHNNGKFTKDYLLRFVVND